MATISKFEDLEIWQEAKKFAHAVFLTYTISEALSKEYKLKHPANASIMDTTTKGFAGEVKSQAYRAFDRKYVTEDQLDILYTQANEPGKNIGGFINYVNKGTFKRTKFKRETVINSKS